MAREREKYFGEPKKRHTEIKHYICCETLKYSIYIANIIANKNKNKQKYIYIDLFAGAGKFEDNSKGSIILALDIILNYLNSEKSKVNKNLYFEVIGVEKDKETFNQLEKSIRPYKSQINIDIKNGKWEDFKEEIKDKLKKTAWGFVFADPFATELDLRKFLELVEVSNMQDFLVFLNINKVLRDLGKENISEKEKERIRNSLKSFLMLDDNEIAELEKNKTDKEYIRNLIVDKLSGYKDFVIGIAIPVEAGGTIRHGDFYYLVLLTNSVGVVDRFLEAYATKLRDFTSGNKQLWNLELDTEFNLMPNKFSLFDFWERLVNKFLSWKDLKDLVDEVPTTENIRNFLNKKFKEGSILFYADGDYFYKRKSKYGEKGMLKKDVLKSKKDLENILIIKQIRQKHLLP